MADKTPTKKCISNKKFSFAFLLTAFFLFSIFSISLISAEQDISLSNGCPIGEVYLEGKGCLQPKFNMDYKIYEAPDEKSISSSLGQIQPIRINNPYAAAGQPVVIEFTLENVGDQLGYPFDRINLPADTYVLQLAVDKDLGVVMSDGRRVDVWGMMTGMQKTGFLLSISTKQFAEVVKNSLKGKTCGYVEISGSLPDEVQNRLKDMNGGNTAKVYTWQCIKIVDYPYFKTELNGYCPDGIDSACISRLNKNVGMAVRDVVNVALTSGTASGLRKGECDRPNSGSFWKNLGGELRGDVNVIECSIGENGLAPSEKVTFRFVALVPSDTPVLNPQALKELDDIKKAEGELFGGYTESASCIDSSNPQACHTVYAAVFPMAHDNLLTFLVGKLDRGVDGLKCAGKWLWNLGKSDYGACMSYGSAEVRTIGEPIWEGRGTFYVLGAALSAYMTFILWGAFIAGALTPFFTGGKS